MCIVCDETGFIHSSEAGVAEGEASRPPASSSCSRFLCLCRLCFCDSCLQSTELPLLEPVAQSCQGGVSVPCGSSAPWKKADLVAAELRLLLDRASASDWGPVRDFLSGWVGLKMKSQEMCSLYVFLAGGSEAGPVSWP